MAIERRAAPADVRLSRLEAGIGNASIATIRASSGPIWSGKNSNTARRFAAVIDAEKQQSSSLATGDVSLVRLGERLSYPELHVKHPGGGHAVVLRAGKANWLHFADVAEGRLIRAVEHAARAIIRGEESLP